jgi:hypothetical protein
MKKTLRIDFVIVSSPGGGKTEDQRYAEFCRRAQEHVREAQHVADKNTTGGCPGLKIEVRYHRMTWEEYQTVVIPKSKKAISTTLGGWSKDPAKDAFKVTPEAKRLLGSRTFGSSARVFMVPGITHQVISGGKRTSQSVPGQTFSPNDFPETTAGYGAGIFIAANADPFDHVLAHELGHLLIDRPRDDRRGDEHGGQSKGWLLHDTAHVGAHAITPEDCAAILRNVDKYSG